jgi:hypothetical protein
VAILLGVAASVGIHGVASADDPKVEAAKSFRAGSEAYARGDFRAAARAFDEAYRVAPRAPAVYNAALAWEGAGELLRAADDYTQALEASDLGTAERADATGRLRALERTLARITVSAPPGTRVTLDDVDEPAWRTTFHVEPGRHKLRAVLSSGKEESRVIAARAGATETVKLVEATDAPSSEPDEGTPGARTPPDAAHLPHDGEGAPSSTPERWPAWIAFGAAAVASGVAIGAYVEGVSALNEYKSGPEPDTNPALRNKALSLRTATWVSWGVAGGCAVAGVVLYLVPPTSSTDGARPRGVSLAVGLHGVSIGAPF